MTDRKHNRKSHIKMSVSDSARMKKHHPKLFNLDEKLDARYGEPKCHHKHCHQKYDEKTHSHKEAGARKRHTLRQDNIDDDKEQRKKRQDHDDYHNRHHHDHHHSTDNHRKGDAGRKVSKEKNAKKKKIEMYDMGNAENTKFINHARQLGITTGQRKAQHVVTPTTSWDSAQSRAQRAQEHLIVHQSRKSEAYGGTSNLADARGSVILGQNPNQVTSLATIGTSQPSLLFLATLIDYVYAVANPPLGGSPITAPQGIIELGKASIALDPVSPIAIIWSSASDPTVGYLIFRGTVGTFEWVVDCYYIQAPYSFAAPQGSITAPPTNEAMVHDGFWTAYDTSLSKTIRSILSKSQITTLYIAGHSMGGALGILAASDLGGLTTNGSALVSLINVWTFGAPRVGNAAFAAAFEALRQDVIPSVLQIRNEDDPVPETPLPIMISPLDFSEQYYYEHVGSVIYFRNPEPNLVAVHSMADYITYAAGTINPLCVPPTTTKIITPGSGTDGDTTDSASGSSSMNHVSFRNKTNTTHKSISKDNTR